MIAEWWVLSLEHIKIHVREAQALMPVRPAARSLRENHTLVGAWNDQRRRTYPCVAWMLWLATPLPADRCLSFARKACSTALNFHITDRTNSLILHTAALGKREDFDHIALAYGAGDPQELCRYTRFALWPETIPSDTVFKSTAGRTRVLTEFIQRLENALPLVEGNATPQNQFEQSLAKLVDEHFTCPSVADLEQHVAAARLRNAL